MAQSFKEFFSGGGLSFLVGVKFLDKFGHREDTISDESKQGEYLLSPLECKLIPNTNMINFVSNERNRLKKMTIFLATVDMNKVLPRKFIDS